MQGRWRGPRRTSRDATAAEAEARGAPVRRGARILARGGAEMRRGAARRCGRTGRFRDASVREANAVVARRWRTMTNASSGGGRRETERRLRYHGRYLEAASDGGPIQDGSRRGCGERRRRRRRTRSVRGGDGGIMVDMFGPRTKAADDYESARRARRPLKGKVERSISGGTSGGGGRMKGKAERETAEAARGRR